MAIWQADYSAAMTFARESTEILGEADDLRGVGRASTYLGIAAMAGVSPETARPYLEQAVRLCREAGRQMGTRVRC